MTEVVQEMGEEKRRFFHEGFDNEKRLANSSFEEPLSLDHAGLKIPGQVGTNPGSLEGYCFAQFHALDCQQTTKLKKNSKNRWLSQRGDSEHGHKMHFPKLGVPEDVVFIEAIPLTATGKLNKLKLRERFKNHFA